MKHFISSKFKGILESLHHSLLISRLKDRFSIQQKLLPNQRMVLMILLFGLLAFLWEQRQDSKKIPNALSAPKSVDTYIPDGYVLVPIQISNAEALDSIIGDKGVVDLFIPDHRQNGGGKKIAAHVKILRAPLNPNQYAILVSEGASANLVHYEGAYFVTVLNPKTLGTQIEESTKRRVASRLIMEDTNETK